jgi:hypothetical protein
MTQTPTNDHGLTHPQASAHPALQQVYQTACHGHPQVALITGDAGLGKTWQLGRWQAQNPLAATFCTLVSISAYPTPDALTHHILTLWTAQLDAVYDGFGTQLADFSNRLGIPVDTLEQWLIKGHTREQLLGLIRQHLPWLKKMTSGLKADVDQLLDLLASPWMSVIQRRRTRLPEITAKKPPTELAHIVLDEWVWLHQQLPPTHNSSVWTLCLDGVDALDPYGPYAADWRIWLNALVASVATAEQLRACLMLTCRSTGLSTWLASTFVHMQPILLGPMAPGTAQAMLAPALAPLKPQPDAEQRLLQLAQGNPAHIQLLALGLNQRKTLFADGLTTTRLDTLGLNSLRALYDWWLVPLQLTPGIHALTVGQIRQLLITVSQQTGPFTPPDVLTAMGLADANPTLVQAAFAVLQQLFHIQLITADAHGYYKVFCRCVLEYMADRFALPSAQGTNAALAGVDQPNQQETLVNVLEVTLLSGQLDQHQLQALWQWCLSSEDPAMLTALWHTLAEQALGNKHPRSVLCGLTALTLSGRLTALHLWPLLTQPQSGVDAMAWRLLCDCALPATDDDQALTAETLTEALSAGLRHPASAVRACALQCAQQWSQAGHLTADPDWFLTALKDSVPWVRRQSLLLLQHQPDVLATIALPTLTGMATQPDPDLLPVVMPLMLERAPAETLLPLALEQWTHHTQHPAIQSVWLNALRQLPLSPVVEKAALEALAQATAPDLIWTLHQKLWRDAETPEIRQALTQLTHNRQSDSPWSDWLHTALRQRLLQPLATTMPATEAVLVTPTVVPVAAQ